MINDPDIGRSGNESKGVQERSEKRSDEEKGAAKEINKPTRRRSRS